jgi:hypothetical protein
MKSALLAIACWFSLSALLLAGLYIIHFLPWLARRRDEERMLALIAVWDDALPALTEEELEACERAMAAVVTLAEIDALSLYDAADWASV